MNKSLAKVVWPIQPLLLFFLAVGHVFAVPLSIQARFLSPEKVYTADKVIIIYQLTNNTVESLEVNSHFSEDMRIIPTNSVMYCAVSKGQTISILPLATCLLKVELIATSKSQRENNFWCVLSACETTVSPLKNVTILPVKRPAFCSANTDNFTYELLQNFASNNNNRYWGPRKSFIHFNPQIKKCTVGPSGENWQKGRVLAAVDFWIKQKLNYCHHHVPDWMRVNWQATKNKGGYCSTAIDLMSNSPYFQQAIRWNYSGGVGETALDWTNNDFMWYGFDCSNFTQFIYNFALGIQFTGNVQWQAGQFYNQNTSPNQQENKGMVDNTRAPGRLVCINGTTGECTNNLYFSTIDHNGYRTIDVASYLNKLQPGDLLFIASNKKNPNKVTHVVLWTGKKIGFGRNDITPNQIAPNRQCPNEWQPKIGEWVIADSHYQGPDYRAFTKCYYQENLWGVRRIIP